MKPNTRKAIKESFMLLLNQKPLSKITVKEIVANCGINRNSFYYHYSDIPTLLEEILIEKADAIFKPEINGNIFGCMTAAIRVALDNKNAMMHILNSANREAFERSLDQTALTSMLRYTLSLTNAARRCFNITRVCLSALRLIG